MSLAFRRARPAGSLRLARPAISLGSGLGRASAVASVKPSFASQSHRAVPALGSIGPFVGILGTRSFSLWSSSPKGDVSTPAPTEAQPEVGSTLGSTIDARWAPEATGSSNIASDAIADPALDAVPTTTPADPMPVQGIVSDSVTDAVNSAAIDPTMASAVVDTANEFAAAGLPSGWLTVPYMQQALEWITQTTGLPWWQIIIGTIFAAKVGLLPLVIKGQRSSAIMAKIQPEMQKMVEEAKRARASGDTEQIVKSSERLRDLMFNSGASPFGALKPMLITMPLFLTLFFSLESMATAGLASMKYGGALWFLNLTAPDPYMILPLVTAATQLLAVEMGPEIAPPGQSAQQAKTMRNIFRVGLLLSPFFLRNFPAAVLLMWATNAILTTTQSYILGRPAVKEYLGTAQPTAARAAPTQPDPVKAMKERLAYEQSVHNAASQRETPKASVRPAQPMSTYAPGSARPPSKTAGSPTKKP